jgi:hypothetical protein
MPNDPMTTETWRCRQGHGLFSRDRLATRRGLLECPTCLTRGAVGSLVPGTHIRCRRCQDWSAASPCIACEAEGGPTMQPSLADLIDAVEAGERPIFGDEPR